MHTFMYSTHYFTATLQPLLVLRIHPLVEASAVVGQRDFNVAPETASHALPDLVVEELAQQACVWIAGDEVDLACTRGLSYITHAP